MKLVDVNMDCLLAIFSYCAEEDLINLCQANNFLRDVIDFHIFSNLTKDLLLCGHRNFNSAAVQRNHIGLRYWERLRVARNWMNGTYIECHYFHHKQMFPAKLYLESKFLYITYANHLRKYRRSGTEALHHRYDNEITTKTASDITDFVKKHNTIFAGRVCGSCFICSDINGCIDKGEEHKMHQALEYLYCVDFAEKDDLFVTGSDKCCKLWHRTVELEMSNFELIMKFQHGFKSLKLSNDGHWLYGGLYTDINRRAVRAINVVSGKDYILNSNTISVYDLKVKDENVIFTANFDTTFRMYDLRLDRDVGIWEDPFDSSLYCLEYDGLYGVLCGAKHHSRVNLYDIRVPGKYVQLYFPSRTRLHNSSSPVYSLTCDNRYLFVATDHNLRVFDFKVACGIQRDYSNIYTSTTYK
ncbi:F-box/WD repeat-containing protein 4 [Scaptodrosophila lebanonensis]|uniref:F-box/WD repeat-containing protein 4 n=1 Tax=Drosophila lebanonensis TaxID=7225 RepID=A0A6J2TTZ1_DROLE|nr:F-box/WD repeat-containing protein 4 [Scaptodrosophila lebanonensis]